MFLLLLPDVPIFNKYNTNRANFTLVIYENRLKEKNEFNCPTLMIYLMQEYPCRNSTVSNSLSREVLYLSTWLKR